MNNNPFGSPNNRPITKGCVVRYKDGWQRVTALYKDHCNIGPVWGGRGRFSGIIKNIPLTEVYEDGEAQYEHWAKSEQYAAM